MNEVLFNPAIPLSNDNKQLWGNYRQREFPKKDPLLEDVLYRRDLVSLIGRRREGKTTLATNIALCGALRPGSNFLGFPVRPFHSIFFYLEDDGMELQEKLNVMCGSKVPLFNLYIREDFIKWGIPVSALNKKFVARVFECVAAAHSDTLGLVVFDNLAHLIGADYNDSTKMHAVMDNLIYPIKDKYNVSVILNVHPRKKSEEEAMKYSLRTDPEAFFETCMGSSHFINSTGSMWGIERDWDTDETYMALGSQRYTGQRAELTVASLSDDKWFALSDHKDGLLSLCINTEQRRQALSLLSAHNREFIRNDAQDICKPAISSTSTFDAWWRLLKRHNVVEEAENGSFRIAAWARVRSG